MFLYLCVVGSNTIYLLLGGNLPDRMQWIAHGRAAIAAGIGAIIQSSAIYETAAWGKEDQGAFLNLALEVRTSLAPTDLLAAIHKIESALGRQREEKWGSRTLDIDILVYGNEVIDLPDLKVPHPQLQNRRFALVPLCDIAPDFNHPVLDKSMKELLDECPDTLSVHVFEATSLTRAAVPPPSYPSPERGEGT